MEQIVCKEKGMIMNPKHTTFGGCDTDVEWSPQCDCPNGQCNFYVLTGCECGTKILSLYND